VSFSCCDCRRTIAGREKTGSEDCKGAFGPHTISNPGAKRACHSECIDRCDEDIVVIFYRICVFCAVAYNIRLRTLKRFSGEVRDASATTWSMI
jgi:hypothetical protein